MNRFFTAISVSSLLLSIALKSTSNAAFDNPNPLILLMDTCECGRGMGAYGDDPPKYIYKFPTDQSISFCGYFELEPMDTSFYAGEFSVFTCPDKILLASYSAVQSCRVELKRDYVVLNRMIGMYKGNGKWEQQVLSQQFIRIIQDSIDISEEEVVLEIPSLSLVDSTEVLATDFRGLNYREISIFLGQLEILALNNIPRAVEILFSKELEEATNAATTEHLLQIRAVYDWVVKGKRESWHWR